MAAIVELRGNVAQESFQKAHYIKLGAGGKYAHSSIAKGIMRFGWDSIPLAEVHAGDWTSIRKRLAREHQNKSTVTSDTERLRDLVSSTPEDLWITFHDSHLWWGRVNQKPVQEDSVSKCRALVQGWHNHDVRGQPLTLTRVPGVIAQLQGFRGTVCSVREVEALKRLINAEVSPAYKRLEASYRRVVGDVQAAIRGLHWKDFEVLVDLVHLLDKLLSENLNRDFFRGDIQLEEEIHRDDGKVQVQLLGPVRLLGDWLSKHYRNADGIDVASEIVEPLKTIRRLRQRPAHAVEQDAFDLTLPSQQDELVAEALRSLQRLRLVLMSHPKARGTYKPPDWLDGENIVFY